MDAIAQLYSRYGINTDAKCTRILDLKAIPGVADYDTQEPLEGSLRIINLDTNPIYNALSYVWGEETADDPTIRIDGVDVAITRNCFDALLQIRKRFGATGIWVDAICINQGDDRERSSQVALMGSIYRKARAVFVWLGADERIDRAFRFLRASSQSSHRRSELGNWDTLLGLLCHDWWRRAWTFQELVLARDPILLTSSGQLRIHQMSQANFRSAEFYHMENIILDSEAALLHKKALDSATQLLRLIKVWRAASLTGFGVATKARLIAACSFVIELFGVLYWVHLLFRRTDYPALTLIFMLNTGFQLWLYHERLNLASTAGPPGKLRSIWPDIWRRTEWRMMLNHLPIIRLCEAIFNVSLLVISRVIFYGAFITWRQIHRAAIWQSYRQAVASAGVLEALRIRQCRDPADHFYALHGVLRALGAKFTKADYATAKQEVYYQLFRDLLLWRWMCLHLLLDAGSPHCSSPSWIPQWDNEHRPAWIHEASAYTDTSTTLYSQLRTIGLPVHEIAGTSLAVLGTQLGSVAFCVHLPQVSQRNTMEDCLHAILSWHWNMQFFGNRSKTTDTARIRSMQQILQLRSMYWWLLLLVQVLTGTTQLPKVIPTLNIDKLHPSNAGKIWTLLRGWGWGWQLQALCDPICGKRLLFITEDGEIGTGPLWTEPGDIVHRISGLPLPLILREQDGGETFRVVGAAMTSHKREEGFSWLRRLERITLV
ncbi:heterokaryon incompatibility protein-domain-containing protein [Paraphoma chrysanthemicola]|nr:heterokaryon incompatibility protein-domain-containing protein [Paraphoma chrysanthemicola]